MNGMIPNCSVIIGLGNPGPLYYKTRHNIGFRIVDTLCEKYNGQWQKKDDYQKAEITVHNKKLLLIKPQTGMNLSGAVIPKLKKMGYESSNILVVYDEMEKSFGSIQIRFGGSHRGHNGVRSLMEHGENFWRFRFGIGRPEERRDVSNYVLEQFTQDEQNTLEEKIALAIQKIEQYTK